MTEMKAGIINSVGMTSPEIKFTFFEVNINGLNLAIEIGRASCRERVSA